MNHEIKVKIIIRLRYVMARSPSIPTNQYVLINDLENYKRGK